MLSVEGVGLRVEAVPVPLAHSLKDLGQSSLSRSLALSLSCVCVCVCVCEREREREREALPVPLAHSLEDVRELVGHPRVVLFLCHHASI